MFEWAPIAGWNIDLAKDLLDPAEGMVDWSTARVVTVMVDVKVSATPRSDIQFGPRPMMESVACRAVQPSGQPSVQTANQRGDLLIIRVLSPISPE